MQNSELSNLYEDIAKDILKNLVFDSSHENQINQLLFISMLENALSHLADDTLDLFNKPKDGSANLITFINGIHLKNMNLSKI